MRLFMTMITGTGSSRNLPSDTQNLRDGLSDISQGVSRIFRSFIGERRISNTVHKPLTLGRIGMIALAGAGLGGVGRLVHDAGQSRLLKNYVIGAMAAKILETILAQAVGNNPNAARFTKGSWAGWGAVLGGFYHLFYNPNRSETLKTMPVICGILETIHHKWKPQFLTQALILGLGLSNPYKTLTSSKWTDVLTSAGIGAGVLGILCLVGKEVFNNKEEIRRNNRALEADLAYYQNLLAQSQQRANS